tara:strand:+ start:455 stop:844 length:390 start_codon:yes stop_codon:yes gene_type:complete
MNKTKKKHQNCRPPLLSLPFRFYKKTSKNIRVRTNDWPNSIYNKRQQLGIWNNKISGKHIGEFNKLVQRNKDFTVDVKLNARYEKLTSDLVKKLEGDPKIKICPRSPRRRRRRRRRQNVWKTHKKNKHR